MHSSKSIPFQPPAAQGLVQRVVQHDRRRYCLRLEPVYWEILAGLAEGVGLRVGELVDTLARQPEAGGNLASYLRVFCLMRLQAEIAGSALGRRIGEPLAALMACPAPGMLLSRRQVVLGANPAMTEWLAGSRCVGRRFGDLFQVRVLAAGRRFLDVWEALCAGRTEQELVRLVHVAPGRLATAQARLAPVGGPAGVAYVVAWLVTGKEGARSVRRLPAGSPTPAPPVRNTG